ncbi:MAG: transglutaminase-like domain-containing protein [Candidatus Roizmanbacteria bacterium]|nr:transglutaminase-like domain-containing protein [Candidatus Roizmanbacteria bacterium]
MRRYFFLIIATVFFVLSAYGVQASPFLSTSLTDRYVLSESSSVRVERSLTFTNRLSDHAIESYTMFFSSQSTPKNIVVQEDGLEASYATRRENDLLALVVTFKNPVQGVGKEKKLFVSYDFDGLVNNQQGYKELMLPVDPKNTEYEQYDIEVVAPRDFPTLGLSKPRVSTVGDHTYLWTNVQTMSEQSVYIAFGAQAFYTVELHYALKNEDGVPHRYEIPFIPDGAYQKAYIESIDPIPEKTRIDEDDNILGSYIVESNSVKNITLQATVALNSILRPELQTYFREKYKKMGMGRYLTQENYWSLPQSVGEFKTSKDIYSYVVDTLSYDTSRINGNLQRMGAAWIVQNPNRAVCMEYTDLFVALARESGIGAREVIGYGVTGGDTSLPLSFLGDVLHAWPEYYDTAREIWHPIDPTWGDTSGVDYYSSLDLNHIAFVYHGTSALFPLPPGVYKLKQNTKDVYVRSTTTMPRETKMLVATGERQRFTSGKKNVLKFAVRSESNIVLYEVLVELKDERGRTVTTKNIPILAPFQTKDMDMAIDVSQNLMWHRGTYTVVSDGESVGTIEYETYSRIIAFLIRYWYIVSGIVFVGFVYIFSSKKTKK